MYGKSGLAYEEEGESNEAYGKVAWYRDKRMAVMRCVEKCVSVMA